MNLVALRPTLSDTARLPIGKAAEQLGLSRATLTKYAAMGRRLGGIDSVIGGNGRRMFYGKEIKRFWDMLTDVGTSILTTPRPRRTKR